MQPLPIIAQYFLARARGAGEPITNLKLQKLVYYAYGHTLGYTGEPLFKDKIEAWRYGPVVPSLYKTYAPFGDSPIAVDVRNDVEETLPGYICAILNGVCNKYMPVDAWTLMRNTHKEVPWQNAHRQGENTALLDEDMKMQFFVRPSRLPHLTDADMAVPALDWDPTEETIDGSILMENLLGASN